ncbi:hypothetical protein H1R20_g4606, partial [Candolleomyces eurysporus]
MTSISSDGGVPAQSQSITIIQSPLTGSNYGTPFNDIERGLSDSKKLYIVQYADRISPSHAVVGFPASVTIDVTRPLKYITIMVTIDGIELEYATNDAETTKFSHGTSHRNTDPYVIRSTLTLGDKENIVAVSGLHGSSYWGVRVLQLSFAICDTRTGRMRVAGPYGSGQPDSEAF